MAKFKRSEELEKSAAAEPAELESRWSFSSQSKRRLAFAGLGVAALASSYIWPNGTRNVVSIAASEAPGVVEGGFNGVVAVGNYLWSSSASEGGCPAGSTSIEQQVLEGETLSEIIGDLSPLNSAGLAATAGDVAEQNGLNSPDNVSAGLVLNLCVSSS